MDEFPHRTPSDDHNTVRGFNKTYWFSSIISGVGWLVTLLGAIGGMILLSYFGVHIFVGGLIGAVVGNVILMLFLRRNLRLHEARMHEEAKSIRDEREAEVQRKIAQAKSDGTFDRWNKASKE